MDKSKYLYFLVMVGASTRLEAFFFGINLNKYIIMNPHQKFLQFNGKTIFFQSYDGNFWIAIKPICEVLNVNYNRQLLTLKNDDFFSQLYSLQDMVGADNRVRKMVCLPEKYIYGWLLSLNSSSPELKSYKKECYDILYNHFHGAITGRKELLKKKVELDIELIKAENELLENPAYMKIQDLKKQQSEVSKGLKNNDNLVIKEQMHLFNYLQDQN